MKNVRKLFIVAMFFSVMAMELLAATGEVTKSGSTWTTKVDGTTKYTGTDMIDAVNAACENVGSGTINVRSSGTANAPDGLRWVNLRSNQTIDFHGNTMDCKNELQVYPVKAYKRSNVTVKNLHVTGVPRYVLHFDHCDDITLTNITSNTSNGNGLRIQDGKNLTINGNINLKTVGHSIETMRFNDIYIGKVTVESSKGCGVLFNTSENCNIDEIWAYNCCPDGSYAGFRQANSNGTTHCKFLRAKNCGRGLYVITSSHNTTVEEVDIDDCNQSGISVEGSAYSVRVNSGTVSNTPKAIDLWNGYSDVCIKVNGGTYGDACSSSGSGTYNSITNRNSGKVLDVEGKSTSNNANVIQYTFGGDDNQQWKMEDAGSGYYRIIAKHSGKCLRAVDGNIVQYTCDNTYWSEMFQKISAGSDYYQLKNRSTNTCIQVEDGSSADGANISLASCNSSYWRQQFTISALKSASITEEPVLEKETNVYPSIIDNILNISLSEDSEMKATVYLFNSSGSMVLSKSIVGAENQIEVSGLNSGIYIVKISGVNGVVTKKIVKK